MWKPLHVGLGAKVVPKDKLGPWLRRALDQSGPTYVKIGQFISNRPDIFGRQLAKDLAPLRDSVSPFEFELVKDAVPTEISNVDPKPIASASIAQVHRAKLKNKEVVLKFKRPGIEKLIIEDLGLMKTSASWLSGFPEMNVVPWLKEFERGLLSELDFKQEVRNIALFRDIYRDRTDVVIPKPYSKFSNDRVIVMDYTPSVDMTFSAERLINMFLEQLLYEGVIHGDLHLGNIGQAPNTDAIVLYDFGNVIKITQQYKEAIRDFVYGVQTSNIDLIIDNMVKMGMNIKDRETTKVFVQQYLKYLNTLDISSFSVSSPELRARAALVPVELDPVTLTILRTYSLLEGICKERDPNFSYEKIINRNIELLFLDLEYIMYRIDRDGQRMG